MDEQARRVIEREAQGIIEEITRMVLDKVQVHLRDTYRPDLGRAVGALPLPVHSHDEFALIDHEHPHTHPGGGEPTGDAGGDLSGTYPNPLVDGLRGISIHVTAGTPTDGDVLIYSQTDNAWKPGPAGSIVPPPPDTYSYVVHNGDYVMYNGGYVYVENP